MVLRHIWDFTQVWHLFMPLIWWALLLLLSNFSRVQLCVTPETESPSLGFSRQEHWSGLPFPSPMHESESEVAQSCPTPRPHGLQPTRLLRPWDLPGKSTGVGCHRLLRIWWVQESSNHKFVKFLWFLHKRGITKGGISALKAGNKWSFWPYFPSKSNYGEDEHLERERVLWTKSLSQRLSG